VPPSRDAGIVARHGIGPVRVFLEKPGQIADAIGEIDLGIVEFVDRSLQSHPPGRAGRDLHQAERHIVDSFLHPIFSGVEPGFLGDDSRDENGINVLGTGYFRDEM
jgi:hypothetical protein